MKLIEALKNIVAGLFFVSFWVGVFILITSFISGILSDNPIAVFVLSILIGAGAGIMFASAILLILTAYKWSLNRLFFK